MANPDNPIGFVPVKLKGGGDNIRLGNYTIADRYGTALGKGDPVQMTGTGRNIEKAEATNVNNVGVFQGCSYIDAQGNPVFSEYWPATTDTKATAGAVAIVIDDPNVIFRIQTDTLSAVDVGKLVDWDAGTPSATTRLSGTELVASVQADSGKSIRILGLSSIEGNEYGAYAKADVMFASHIYATGAAGAGGV